MSQFLTHVTHRAMACEFVVYLPSHARKRDVEIVVEAFDGLQQIESRLTVYDPESEISRVNRFAGQPVRVSHATATLVERANQWSARTRGAFDISAGPLIDAWGFTNRKGQRPDDDELAKICAAIGWEKVDVCLGAAHNGESFAGSARSQHPTIRLENPGMKINLGAIGKGHAMDVVADHLLKHGVEHFLMHAGASSVVARGSEQANTSDGWSVGLAHPTIQGRRLGRLHLMNQAMATSGSGRQFFHHRGKRYGHVLDPRTGLPAGDSLCVTVIADNATDADAAATAAFILDSTGRKSLEMPMVIVGAGVRQNEVNVTLCGNPAWQASDSHPESKAAP